MADGTLTKDEQAFVRRMAPYVAAGKSIEEAARAVLADDERIWRLFCAYEYSPIAKELQAERRHILSDRVYHLARASQGTGE